MVISRPKIGINLNLSDFDRAIELFLSFPKLGKIIMKIFSKREVLKYSWSLYILVVWISNHAEYLVTLLRNSVSVFASLKYTWYIYPSPPVNKQLTVS